VSRVASGRRDGFALLAVLWVLAGATALGLLLMLAAREAQGTAANRIALTRARWIAEGCVERARAAVDESVDEDVITDSAWAALDRLIVGTALTDGCQLSVVPVGLTLDVNAADTTQLRRLLVAASASPPAADSMAAAILDWRDADDETRQDGAERDWYERAERVPPRNGSFASTAELASVRGLGDRADVRPLLGVEPGRILLSRAPPAVLAALPGMSAAVIAVVEERRAVRDSMLDLPRLVAIVPAEQRDPLVANLPTLTALLTALPDAWIIAAEASDGRPIVTARLELRVVRSGRRLAIVRRRSES
jgi:type II secretory pathway component PulK